MGGIGIILSSSYRCSVGQVREGVWFYECHFWGVESLGLEFQGSSEESIPERSSRNEHG